MNRTLTTQEESILLPLIQGLIEAGGGTFSTDQINKQSACTEEKDSVKSKKEGEKKSNKLVGNV